MRHGLLGYNRSDNIIQRLHAAFHPLEIIFPPPFHTRQDLTQAALPPPVLLFSPEKGLYSLLTRGSFKKAESLLHTCSWACDQLLHPRVSNSSGTVANPQREGAGKPQINLPWKEFLAPVSISQLWRGHRAQPQAYHVQYLGFLGRNCITGSAVKGRSTQQQEAYSDAELWRG